MDSIEFKRAMWACNNTEDKDIIRENVEKVIESNNPYYLCDLIENSKKLHTPEYVKAFEDAIVSVGDIVHTYEFMFLLADMGVKDFDLKRFEAIIKESGNPKLMLYCLGFVEGINQETMLQALYETKNAKYIEALSVNEEYADINVAERPEYAEQLELAKKYNYFPKSLEDFKGESAEKVDVRALIYQVIRMNTETPEQQRKKSYLINELANYIEYLAEYHGQDYDVEMLKESISLLQEAECVTAANEPLHLYEFAASVDTDDKGRIINGVIQNNIPKYLHYCLEYVPNLSDVDRRSLEVALDKSQNAKYKVDSPTEDAPAVSDPRFE